MLRRFIERVRRTWYRRYYFLAKLLPPDVPEHNLSWLPGRFCVRRIGATGVRLIDDFATREEATALVDAARNAAGVQGGYSGGVYVNDVAFTGTLSVHGGRADDPALLALLHRCSLLFGVPYTHTLKIVLARLGIDSPDDLLSNNMPARPGQRLHTLLLYLSDIPGDTGGETLFEQLNLAITPRTGRAVAWSVPTGAAATTDTAISEVPLLSADADKWVLQLWFADRPLRHNTHTGLPAAQAVKGVPLDGTEPLPNGVWAPTDLDLEAVFGKPDKLEGLV